MANLTDIQTAYKALKSGGGYSEVKANFTGGADVRLIYNPADFSIAGLGDGKIVVWLQSLDATKTDVFFTTATGLGKVSKTAYPEFWNKVKSDADSFGLKFDSVANPMDFDPLTSTPATSSTPSAVCGCENLIFGIPAKYATPAMIGLAALAIGYGVGISMDKPKTTKKGK